MIIIFFFYRNGGNFWNLLAKSDFKDFDSDTNLEVGWIVSKTVRCVDISSNPFWIIALMILTMILANKIELNDETTIKDSHK